MPVQKKMRPVKSSSVTRCAPSPQEIGPTTRPTERSQPRIRARRSRHKSLSFDASPEETAPGYIKLSDKVLIRLLMKSGHQQGEPNEANCGSHPGAQPRTEIARLREVQWRSPHPSPHESGPPTRPTERSQLRLRPKRSWHKSLSFDVGLTQPQAQAKPKEFGRPWPSACETRPAPAASASPCYPPATRP